MSKSTAERLHHERISQMPCVLCLRIGNGPTKPVAVHHLREGQGKGQRADHFLVIPLCHDCHQGDRGVHGDRTYLRIAKCGELELLADTIRMLLE